MYYGGGVGWAQGSLYCTVQCRCLLLILSIREWCKRASWPKIAMSVNLAGPPFSSMADGVEFRAWSGRDPIRARSFFASLHPAPCPLPAARPWARTSLLPLTLIRLSQVNHAGRRGTAENTSTPHKSRREGEKEKERSSAHMCICAYVQFQTER